ncbi:MAG: hypothetical protein CM15mP74_14880 [Halieaceae bacterium]|nr:MAG: hypothetical protein CM15mP74_14880 [Halieaceae bacterium]
MDGDPATRQQMAERAGQTSVPQIWIGEQHIGGVTSCMVSSVQAALIRCSLESVARLDLIEKESLHG